MRNRNSILTIAIAICAVFLFQFGLPKAPISSQRAPSKKDIADPEVTREASVNILPSASNQESAPISPLPQEPDIAALLELALNGDIDAAFKLGEQLFQCELLIRQVPTQQEYESVLRTIAISSQTGADAEMFEREYQQCSSHASIRASAPEWLMLAADQGNIDAQLLFAAAAEVIYETAPDAVRDWHQKRGVEYLIQARDHGSDIAALNLAHVFSEKDPSEAYTNAMLATLIGNQRIQHQVDADYHSIARAQALLNVARTKMDDEQVAAARSRARDIFARCCGGS